MKHRDQRLGMAADISRRDFLSGMSIAIGASLLPSSSSAQNRPASRYYPPQRSGLRGSHAGSFESAHLAWDGATWNGEDSGERYDLVVVGAGISGLAAA